MGKMTNVDRLRRAEARLTYESEKVREGIDRLEGIKDPHIIAVRQSYIYMQDKIREHIFMLRGQMDREGTR